MAHQCMPKPLSSTVWFNVLVPNVCILARRRVSGRNNLSKTDCAPPDYLVLLFHEKVSEMHSPVWFQERYDERFRLLDDVLSYAHISEHMPSMMYDPLGINRGCLTNHHGAHMDSNTSYDITKLTGARNNSCSPMFFCNVIE